MLKICNFLNVCICKENVTNHKMAMKMIIKTKFIYKKTVNKKILYKKNKRKYLVSNALSNYLKEIASKKKRFFNNFCLFKKKPSKKQILNNSKIFHFNFNLYLFTNSFHLFFNTFVVNKRYFSFYFFFNIKKNIPNIT